MSCMSFVQHQSILSLARVDPAILQSKMFRTKSGSSWRLYVNNEPAVSVIPSYCIKSSVTQLSDKNYKYVHSIPHCQEWERIVGALGMSFGHARFIAQVYRDAVCFQTLPTSTNTSSQDDNVNFGFQGIQSAATVASATNAGYTKSVLNSDDEGKHCFVIIEQNSYAISSASLRRARGRIQFGTRC